MSKPLIIIPARMGASRFYGKPLEKVNGLPMIVKIMQQAQNANIGEVIVATPDKEIIDLVTKQGGKAVLTSHDCQSGTDRVAMAAEKILAERGTDKDNSNCIVVNLQGDLAVFDNEILNQVVEALHNHKDFDIATPCVKITTPSAKQDPNTVKVVMSYIDSIDGNKDVPNQKSFTKYGKALYFTRATCPYGDGDLYQHLGIYAYRLSALKKFVALEPSPLEKRENLEQLRALENDLKIIVVTVNNSIPLEVNTPEDLAKINSILKNKI